MNSLEVHPAQGFRPPQNRVIGVMVCPPFDRGVAAVGRVAVDTAEGAGVVRADVNGLDATAPRPAGD